MSDTTWPHRPHPRSIPAIAEAHGKLWEIRTRPPGHFAAVDSWPVVTLSYEHGIPGKALGRALAERLMFEAWDEERVTRVARRLVRDTSRPPKPNSRSQSAADDFLFSVWHGPEGPTDEQLVSIQRTLQHLSLRGRTVLVGRGVRLLVHSGLGLHVRLVAQAEKRIQWFAAHNRMSLAQAESLIANGDTHESGLMRETIDRGTLVAPAYDIILNLDTFDPDRTVGLMLMAYLAKFGKLPTPAIQHHVALITSIVYLQPPIGADAKGFD